MQGEFATARDLYTRARLMLEEFGRSVVSASTSQQSCRVELLAGDPPPPSVSSAATSRSSSEMGEQYFLSTVAGELAQAVYAQGRYAEAEELTRLAEELSADDDLTSQALWRSVGRRRSRGAGSARRRRSSRARRWSCSRDGRAAVQADALEDLAEVSRSSGPTVPGSA